MFNSKYSNVLTIVLIIIIIAIVGLIGFLGYDIYKKYYIEKMQIILWKNMKKK